VPSNYLVLVGDKHRRSPAIRLQRLRNFLHVRSAMVPRILGRQRQARDRQHLNCVRLHNCVHVLARYPQLYSRVGFVHEFRLLTKGQILKVLQTSWRPEGVHQPMENLDEESLAAIVRITGGNFRLLHRLFSQIGHILEINQLGSVTASVVDAARESLVIGAV
jgi:hypothetical protein